MRKAIKLKQDNLKRSKILSKLFASLFMAVGAVIIVVAFVPKSPVASIDEIQVFKDKVAYQVSVTDEDHVIIENSLSVILENQFEYQSTSITTGSSVGMFESLSPGTLYTLKVMANIGFGMELLAKTTFETEENPGGMIVNNFLLSAEDDYQLNYKVSAYISDPYDEISNTYMKVSYVYMDQSYAGIVEKADIILSEGMNQFTVTGLYNENIQVTYQLMGTKNNEEVVLDTYVFYTPVMIYSSCSPIQILPDKINLGIYAEVISSYNTTYRVLLYEGDRLLESVPYTVLEESFEQMDEESSGIWFDELVNNHTYHIELWVNYTDPSTFSSVDKRLKEFDFTTPRFASYTAWISDHQDYIEVFISGDDPYAIYQNAGYVVYDEDGAYHYFHFMGFSTLVLEEGKWTASFVIDKDVTQNQVFSVYVFSDDFYEIRLYLYEYEPL